MQTCSRVWGVATLIRRLPHVRYASSVALDDPSKIRNIALLAHIDSGKTTLTESILQATSYLSNAGTVDTGSTTTDFLPAERERGITIQSASIPVKWKDWTFNLIDTPGHVDFGMEVESASRVIDGAVVLMDSVEGVEGQTLGVWRQLDRHSVPTRMIFLNKLDRPGSSVRESMRSIVAKNLHHNPLLLTLPVSSFDDSRYRSGEPGVSGIVDLVNWRVWRWTDSGEKTSQDLPSSEEALSESGIFSASHPLVPEIFKAREALLDNISLHSSEFMEELLSLPSSPSPYLSIPSTSIISALRSLTLERSILPVVCGAALRHIGTNVALDFVGDLLASPADVRAKPASDKDGAQVLAWKVGWDKQRGWMTFVRVYSGDVTRTTTLFNTGSQQREKLSKLVLLYADKPQSVEVLPFGSVGVILGLKHTRTGDTLLGKSWNDRGGASQSSSLAPIVPPPAVISASVIPQSQSDVQPVKEALLALSRTDPSVRITEDEEEGQTLVHGLGALHLEIVEGRLRDEWGVRCRFGKRRVSYRETLGPAGSIEPIVTKDSWQREVAGKVFKAEVELEVRPLTEDEIATSEESQAPASSEESGVSDVPSNSTDSSAWSGNIVLDESRKPLPHPSSLRSDDPLMPLLSGLASTLATSPHTGLPLSRAHITIKNVIADEDAPPMCFTGAASTALRHAIVQSGQGDVMEPYVRVKVTVGPEHVGRVAGDLTEHSGEIMDLDASGDTGADFDAFRRFEEESYCPPAWLTPSSAGNSVTGSGVGQANRSILAVAPLSRMLDYSTRLRAASGGLGVFEMSVEGFRVVPELRKREILEEIGR
ncbi:P-loop containing nucleoside triphosphate hydrolase protein [Clavulina sp. PMI_390]|nr:P-loop containing nucleoside triphosphate hydrolase protein [Clavulina sp. PMI_390]